MAGGGGGQASVFSQALQMLLMSAKGGALSHKERTSLNVYNRQISMLYTES